MAQKPRLRFAPSPTGYLHIGGVRTALFNWLWAKKTGGTFILRIEDTDRERSTPENERIIIDDMTWLGLDWNEGPNVGGDFGPYKQMERLPIYQEYVEKLIASKGAYRCYCTKEELDAQRDALKKQDPKAQFRYPGTCKNRVGPPPDRPFVIRLNAPTSGAVTYHDMVFGEVTTPNSAQQDVVLMRSDGVPLYNLGCVVDDVTMGITIVARGRDHMINTPLQILLYEALGKTPPQFAHLPMMLGKDGIKLSKRHDAVAVGEYRDRGIPPQALLNYLVRFGWSYNDQEIFALPDLIEKFDWARCGRGDGKFDGDKLASITFEHLKNPELMTADAYIDGLMPFLTERGLTHIDREKVRAALPLYRERGQTWKIAADAMDYVFRDPPVFDEKAVKKFLVKEKAPLLREVAEMVKSAPDFTPPALEAGLQKLLEAKSLQLKDLAQPARVALSGRSASPGLFEVVVLLGRDRAVQRLLAAADMAEKA